MTWKNVKVKTFGGYEIRKHRNSYEGTHKDGTGKVDRFSVWQSVTTDSAWDKEDINPFIAEAQKQSQTQIKRLSKLQYEQALANVRYQFKKKTGNDISIFQLKKNIKNHANKVLESKKEEIKEAVNVLRGDEMKKELEQSYSNCKFTEDEKGLYCNRTDGTVLKLNENKFNGDRSMGLLPDDLSEFEKWELYGEDNTVKEQQSEPTENEEKTNEQ